MGSCASNRPRTCCAYIEVGGHVWTRGRWGGRSRRRRSSSPSSTGSTGCRPDLLGCTAIARTAPRGQAVRHRAVGRRRAPGLECCATPAPPVIGRPGGPGTAPASWPRFRTRAHYGAAHSAAATCPGQITSRRDDGPIRLTSSPRRPRCTCTAPARLTLWRPAAGRTGAELHVPLRAEGPAALAARSRNTSPSRSCAATGPPTADTEVTQLARRYPFAARPAGRRRPWKGAGK